MQTVAKVIRVRKENHDVVTIFLKPEKNIDFISGQYCLVSSREGKEKKPFTFANSPLQKDHIELTVKKLGKFSSYLHDLKEGDELVLEGPMGEKLNFDESISKDVVFLAGGSGITPFISALRYAKDKKLSNNLILINSNRKSEDIIFKKELAEIDSSRNIKVINTLSQDSPPDWQEERGRIDERMIKEHIGDLENRLIYICGPPGMVKAMKKILFDLKVKSENIRLEDWQIPGKHDNKENKITKKEKKVYWRCTVCKDIHYGKAPPHECPTCEAIDAYEEISVTEAKIELR